MFTLTWKTKQLKAFMKRRGELWADVSPLPSRAQLRIERSREEHAQPAVPAWQTPPVKKHTRLRAHITTQCVIHTCTNTHTDTHRCTHANTGTGEYKHTINTRTDTHRHPVELSPIAEMFSDHFKPPWPFTFGMCLGIPKRVFWLVSPQFKWF